jgi:hypothetical protein
MNLTEKFRNSWQLMLASIQVLRSHPRLALFPFVIFLATLAIFVFMIGIPVGLVVLLNYRHVFGQVQEHQVTQLAPLASTLVGAFIYLVSMYVATFSNVAFYEQIMRAFAGEPVSIRAGIAFAWRKRLQILYWSLLASTVGIVLRAIAERLGIIGSLVLRFIGLAWSVAAIFVIPVIIRSEEKNPIRMLRASVGTLKQTWGENLVAFLGTRLAGLLIIGPSFLLCALLALLSFPLDHPAPAIIAGALFLLILVATLYLGSLTEHIFRCATYVYATEGVVPEAYTSEQLDQAWKVRGK